MSKYGWRNNKIRAQETKTDTLTVENKITMSYSIASCGLSTVGILDGADFNAVTTTPITEFLGQPPYPMKLSIQAVDAGTAANTDAITIIGTTAENKAATEDVIVSSTAKAITYSLNAYARITSLAGNNSSFVSTDVNVGYNTTLLGLPHQIATSSDILSLSVQGAITATATKTISSTYNTVTNDAAAGNTLFVMYRTKLQDADEMRKND